jgi:hypothetical protein
MCRVPPLLSVDDPPLGRRSSYAAGLLSVRQASRVRSLRSSAASPWRGDPAYRLSRFARVGTHLGRSPTTSAAPIYPPTGHCAPEDAVGNVAHTLLIACRENVADCAFALAGSPRGQMTVGTCGWSSLAEPVSKLKSIPKKETAYRRFRWLIAARAPRIGGARRRVAATVYVLATLEKKGSAI